MHKFVFCLLLCFFSSFQNIQAQNLKVMVFAPHPDDDLIGVGGSIAKHLEMGNKVIIIYMTSGDAGSLKYSKTELAKIREKEAQKGALVLGVKDIIFLRNADGYLEASKENLAKVITLIREHKPNIIYVTHAEEGHPDHRRTNEIVVNAAGRAKGPWFQEASGKPWAVSTILAYEVHPPLREANYCEDISKFINLKVKALEEHKSQLEDISYHNASKALSEYRGILTNGSKYAECFHIIQADKLF